MARSHDLVQFMKQEERVFRAKFAQADIDKQKSVINQHERKDDPKIEEKLMGSDSDCLKAGKPLSQHDLFTSSALTVESFGLEEYLALPLLNLASVLHQSSKSKEAAQVLDAVLILNETLPSAHCVAADVYAVAIQYNKSILSFDECIRTDPSYPGVHVRRAAVRCHQKLEKALESQHENLQKTLTELQSYQTRLKTYQELHQQTYKNVADQEIKRQMSLSYDYFTYGPINYLNCKWVRDNMVLNLNCVVDDDIKYVSAKRKRQHALYDERKVKNVTQVGRIQTSVGSLSQTAPVDFDKEKAFLDALEPMRGTSLAQPTIQRKYPVMNKREWNSVDFVFQSEFWPDEEECKINTRPVPSLRDIPHVFLSPRNKGFEVEELLTRYLNLGEGEEHPLPWYPPFCSALVGQSAKIDLPCCDHLLGVQRAKKRERDQIVAEYQLRDTFLSLTRTPLETEAEMGQRIHTLLKYCTCIRMKFSCGGHRDDYVTPNFPATLPRLIASKNIEEIGPRWLLLNLAALYWRVVGVSAEAVTCLRLALFDDAGKHYADVALVQLSQLTNFAGDRLDDGIVLAKQAVQVDSKEPASHYLLGYYLALKRNYTGALQHLVDALNLDPKYDKALSALKSIRCHMKSLHGEERCYLEDRLDPLIPSSRPSLAPSCNRQHECEVPSCVAPPALAPILLPVLDSSSEKFCYFPNGPKSAKDQKKVDEHGICAVAEKQDNFVPSRDINPVEKESGPKGKQFYIVTPISPEDGQEEVTLDADNIKTATGRDINTLPPVVKPPPSQRTVRYYTIEKIEGVEVEEIEKELNEVQADVGETVLLREDVTDVGKEEILPVAGERGNMDNTDADSKEEDGVNSFDSSLPEVLPKPFSHQIRSGARLVSSLPSSTAECAQLKKHVRLDQATSTWLSVTAKGVKLDQYIDFSGPPPKEILEPVCPDVTAATMWTLDHLHGFRLDDVAAEYKPEKGLKDAFQNLGNKKDSLQGMASRLAKAIKNSKGNPNVHMNYEGGVHWCLTTAAALYWRVEGNLSMSVRCLRHSLNNAPYHMRDLALVSLANVYHQAGLLHSALIAAGSALQLSPRFVVIHFTLANIYSAMGYFDHAMMFYYSTLALQNNFDPARERIRAIYCLTGRIPDEAQNIDDQ